MFYSFSSPLTALFYRVLFAKTGEFGEKNHNYLWYFVMVNHNIWQNQSKNLFLEKEKKTRARLGACFQSITKEK